ncbi:MAG: hypothetical protein LBU70_08710 [Chitinispirillales bacterium]|nr:hypothetical protein [Chitinispirillales bacterium]
MTEIGNLDIYDNKTQRPRGTGKQKPVSRKFKIPEKGRIRLVLILVLIIIGIRFTGPCLSGDTDRRAKRTENHTEEKNIDGVTSKRTNNQTKKNIDDAIDNHIDNRTDTTTDSMLMDAPGRPRRLGRLARFFMDKKARREEQRFIREAAARRHTAQHDMSFDDVRQLFKTHDIGIGASRQTVIVDKDTLTISLSIDTVLQRFAQTLFRRYKPRYAAAAAIDPATGRVLALASFANEGEELDGSDLYLKSIFPAASVFKTIVAAAGIERAGMNSQTAIPHYGRNHTLFMSQIQENLRVSRDVTLQDAFAYSINPAFARIALFNTNKDAVFDVGQRFGFNESIPFELDADTSVMFYPEGDFSIAEFASGFNRKTLISPLFGAMIAAAVCQGGIIFEPTIVDSVTSSRRDTVVYTREHNIWRRAIRESTASELRQLMTSVTRYGTARNQFRPLRTSNRFGRYEYGGKTGNVNKLGLGRVDWFVGYAKDPNNKDRRIAVGVVTTHGEFWTVHSSFIAGELFRRYIIIEEQNQSL